MTAGVAQVRQVQIGPDAGGRQLVMMFELDDGHYAVMAFDRVAAVVEDVKRRLANGEKPAIDG